MTNKEKTLHNLHQARTSHVRWVNSIKLLISGIDVLPETITLSATDSLFGKWFYEEAMIFSLGTSRMVLEEIEELFLSLHDKYLKIYPIYYGKNKKTLFGGFLGSKTKVSEYELEFSQRYYEEIVTISDKLKHKLRILESQLMSLEENKFALVTSDALEEQMNLKIAEALNNDENAYFYGARGR
jgi:hypothetical protein